MVTLLTRTLVSLRRLLRRCRETFSVTLPSVQFNADACVSVQSAQECALDGPTPPLTNSRSVTKRKRESAKAKQAVLLSL